MPKIRLILTMLIVATAGALAQNTTTTTTTYQNGQVTKVYRNGVVTEIYQNGVPIDISYYGSLITVKRTTAFDLRNENSPLYRGKFEQYLAYFLANNRLNQEGRFVPQPNARTPMNQLTRDEFKHYVAEGRPTMTIDGIESCTSCSGTGRRTGLVGTQISEVVCEKCNGRGHFAYTETISLTNTAPLPKRPTVADFIGVGLIEAKETPEPADEPAPDKGKKSGMMGLDFKKIIPKPESTPPPEAPKAMAPVAPAPEIELTPMQRFQMAKGKAEAGNGQAQYELALFYLQESERPVPLDYFEAYSWMLKAATKNHRMAQFYLARLYENGQGTDKNLESSISWRRRAALLGCKQAQRWMGQLYLDVFNGNPKYSEFIKKDPTNLIEAYAWFNLGAEVPFPPRVDPKTPGPEEIANGDTPLSPRDYNFEKSIPTSAARDRDGIARIPDFNKKMYEEAKARCVSLAKEASDFRAENRPK